VLDENTHCTLVTRNTPLSKKLPKIQGEIKTLICFPLSLRQNWIESSRARSRVKVWKFSIFPGTDSVPIFRVLLRFFILAEVFPRFFLSCKANARVKPVKTGHGPHSSKFFVLFYVLFALCLSVYFSVYCLCVNVYCTTATGWLLNCS